MSDNFNFAGNSGWMIFLVGIDDTDTLETRGTGFHARMMGAGIETAGMGKVLGITRHQNYVHPEIPYTSHNSSACLKVQAEDLEKLKEFCREFLLKIAPIGSDVGLCIAEENNISEKVVRWGLDAKQIILYQDDARYLAKSENIYLEGLTGTQGGIIGALAAVGLRKWGNDGRFLYLKGKKELREISALVYSQTALAEDFCIEQIIDKQGLPLGKDEPVQMNEWFRPVMKNNKVTLIVEKQLHNGQYFWQVANKDYIRANS